MTVDAVDIRDARYDDAARLAAVCRDAYAANVEAGFPSFAATASAADVEGWLHDRDVFVAELDEEAAAAADATDASHDESTGDIVGAVQLRHRSERDVLELGRLAVVEAYEERGIGGLLVEHAEAVARERGHDRLRLRTFTGHPVLPDWYERLGYERVGREPVASRPYDVLIMAKRL